MKNIMITVAHEGAENIKYFAETLIREGVRVTHVYPFGVISATADEDEIAKIKTYKQVLSVDEEETVSVPPPESTIQ